METDVDVLGVSDALMASGLQIVKAFVGLPIVTYVGALGGASGSLTASGLQIIVKAFVKVLLVSCVGALGDRAPPLCFHGEWGADQRPS